jgi:hypothetical protein
MVSADPMTQQEFLRAACSAMDITQKELADRMATSWSTFRKWLVPTDAGDYRAMPDMAWQLVREILAHEQLKARFAVLVIEKHPNGGYSCGIASSKETSVPIHSKTPEVGATQEFTLETKSGRWFQAAIQHVGSGIYTPNLARSPKATKENTGVFYDTLPTRGGAGLDEQLSELMTRANARFTDDGADPITTIYMLDGPSLLPKAEIAKVVGDAVRVVSLPDAPEDARQINLKVSFHPSGRYTLMKKDEGDSRWRDCRGLLFGNSSAGSFYRAVAQFLHELQHQGHKVTYQDTNVELG